MGVCRNYRLRHSPLFFVWPFLSIMSKTAIQYLRSKAMSKTLPPPSDDTKVRYAKGRWRELALFGGNERSDEACLNLHIRKVDGQAKDAYPLKINWKIWNLEDLAG